MATVVEAVNLAIAHYNAGRTAEAATVCRAVLAVLPDQPTTLEVLALCLERQGEAEAARRCLRAAIAAAPAAGRSYGLLARLSGTGPAAGLWRRALLLDPAVPGAAGIYGGLLTDLGRLEEAVAPLRLAVAEAPSDPEQSRRLAITEQRRGALDQARRLFRRAHRLGADDGVLAREALVLPVIPESEAEIADCRRRFAAIAAEMVERRVRIEDPLRSVGTTAFFLSYHGLDNRALHGAMAAAYAAACPSLAMVAPHCLSPRPPKAGQPLRLGILSDHLYSHTIGQLNRGLVEHLSRGRFHVTLLTTAGPDDPIRRKLHADADAVVTIPNDLDGARRRVAAEELDILYYPDIGMSPFTYFLAFARLAPLQCLTWGHPDTTGIPTLDCFLTCDAMEPPGAEAHYTERLLRLPGTTLYYHRPQPDPAPGAMRDRAGLGLSEDAHLYVCPQSLFKIHPRFDELLIALLRRDPRGLLVFVDPRRQGEALRRRLAAGGRDVCDRIRFLPGLSNPDFLALVATADVMLDPLHYSGGNTSLEAFSVGTPIVTWPGGFMRGRHTHGFYRLMGMDDCVARDPAHYLELALALGTDPGARRWVSRRILERNAVLYEDIASIRAIEDALTAAHAQAVGQVRLPNRPA